MHDDHVALLAACRADPGDLLPRLILAETMYHAPESVEWHYPAAYAVCCVATAASDYGSAAVEAAVDALGLAGCAYRHFHGAERKIRG
jgi:hypothetical protein